MKKIVLGCAALLLSLGLLAGCDDNPSTVDAVIINVDSSASVVVGQTLELPYSVEPEKATVVAASDHEEYVTADAQDGILYLHGVTEGSAIVTLVGTYKKYAEANVNINVSVVTEADEKTEPGVPDTGGTPEKTDPVIGTVTEGDYWLGFTMGEVDYYFDGSLSGYYGSVTSDGWSAATVTVAAVTEGGYTLSFVDEDQTTQYLYAYVASNDGKYYVDLGIQEDPFTWQYDTAFETFVVELNDQWNFIGTYGSYVSLSMNDYGYLTGDTSTSYDQYPAKLFTPIEYSAPESITISGENEVELGSTIQLSLSFTPTEGNINQKVIWSSSVETVATVSDTGVVTGISIGETEITATSAVNDQIVSNGFTVSVVASSFGYAVVADWQNTYSGTTFKLGCEYETGTIGYLDGHVEGTYTYEATAALNFDSGVDITVTKVDGSEDNAYYLSYPFGDTTYYVCIINNEGYQNLQLVTEATPIYWDSTNGVWTNQADTYFLCWNNSYGYICASSISYVSTYVSAKLMVWQDGTDTPDHIVPYDEVTKLEGVAAGSTNTNIAGNTTTHTCCTIDWTGGNSQNGIKPYDAVSSSGYRDTVRVYNGSSFTIKASEGYTLTRVIFEGVYSHSNADSNGSVKASFTGGVAGPVVQGYIEDYVQVVMDANATELTATSSGTWYLAYITVYYTVAD